MKHKYEQTSIQMLRTKAEEALNETQKLNYDYVIDENPSSKKTQAASQPDLDDDLGRADEDDLAYQ